MDLRTKPLFAAVLALAVGFGPAGAYAQSEEKPEENTQPADTGNEGSSGGETSTGSGSGSGNSGSLLDPSLMNVGLNFNDRTPTTTPPNGFQFADDSLSGLIDSSTGRFDFKGGEGGMIRPQIAETLAQGGRLVTDMEGNIMGVTARGPDGRDMSYPLERHEIAGLQQLMSEQPKPGDPMTLSNGQVGTFVAPGLALGPNGEQMMVGRDGSIQQGPLSPEQQARFDRFANDQAESALAALEGQGAGAAVAETAAQGLVAATNGADNPPGPSNPFNDGNGVNTTYPEMPVGWHPPMAPPPGIKLSDSSYAALTGDDSLSSFGANGFNGGDTALPPGGAVLARNPSGGGATPGGGTPADSSGGGRAWGLADMTESEREAAKNAAIAYQNGQSGEAVNSLAAGSVEDSGWPDFGKFKQTFARLFSGDSDATPGLASRQLGNWNSEMQSNVIALGHTPEGEEGWTIDGANLGGGSAHGNPNNRAVTSRKSASDFFHVEVCTNAGSKC